MTLLTKANGGKAAALNEGLRCTNADVIVTLDADTLIAPDAVASLARRFSAPKIGAVAGNAKVGVESNLAAKRAQNMPLLSGNQATFDGELGDLLREMFPEPCKYEKA